MYRDRDASYDRRFDSLGVSLRVPISLPFTDREESFTHARDDVSTTAAINDTRDKNLRQSGLLAENLIRPRFRDKAGEIADREGLFISELRFDGAIRNRVCRGEGSINRSC